MARSEWSELLRVLDASAHEREPDASLLALLMDSFGVGGRMEGLFMPRSPVQRQTERAPMESLPGGDGMEALTVPREAMTGGTELKLMESLANGDRANGMSMPPPVVSGSKAGGVAGAFQLPLGGLVQSSREATQSPTPVVSVESRAGGIDGVLKTIGTVTGVGPLAAGLLKLFGGGSDHATQAAPALPFSLPDQISLEAGLAADRSFVPVAYSQRGVSRAVAAQQGSGATPAQVLVNVQAMDSRSFLDHSDDIARAVRDAMLRSHSLNDVVAEI